MILTAVLFLFIALLPLPYGYYILLRFVVCFAAIREICLLKNNSVDTILILTGIAILYNPIIKMPLGRSLWLVVNIITALFFIHYIIKRR